MPQAGRVDVLGDADVVARSVRDPEEFGRIFEEHFDAIFRYAARVLPVDVAEDCASETFVIAFRKRRDYRPGRGTVRAWLFGICVRLIADQRRKGARGLAALARSVGNVATGFDDPIEQVAGQVDAQRQSALVLPALAAMKSGDRDALLLYAWANLTYAEIAAVLKIPVGAVRSRIHRARNGLRDVLASQERSRDGVSHDSDTCVRGQS